MNNMNPIEELKNKIETERQNLDKILLNCTMEEAYNQSKLVDGLIEEYISLAS